MPYQIIVCAGLAPDPLQSLEPVSTPAGPGLKNEMMLPNVLDPWAGHALFEAGHLAAQHPGSTVKVVCMGPKAKIQQVMMTVAQKVQFDLIPVDVPAAGGFTDSVSTARELAAAIKAVPGFDPSTTLVFGGWESATRGAGVVMQMVAERLGIGEVFLAVDELVIDEAGSMLIKERCEGGVHQVSRCTAGSAVLAWATGNLPEPQSNPKLGMANMRTMAPALATARKASLEPAVEYVNVAVPAVTRETRVVKDMPVADIAREIVEWIRQ